MFFIRYKVCGRENRDMIDFTHRFSCQSIHFTNSINFIAEKLNRMDGPVRFFLPEGGVSMLDAPNMPFWDPVADQALFTTIEAAFRPTPERQLIRTPLHVNDPAFAELLVQSFKSLLN